MNKEVVIYGQFEYIARSLILINKETMRRSISEKEFILIRRNIGSVAINNNIDIAVKLFGYEQNLETFFEVIRTNDDTFYRLKPNLLITDLKDFLKGSLTAHKAILFSNEDLLKNAILYSLDDEREFREFQQFDQKCQLKKIYDLFNLIQQVKEKEQELGIVQINSTIPVDEKQVKDYLKQNPKISFEDLAQNILKKTKNC